MTVGSRSDADCCIVAVANYFEKPYEDVLAAFELWKSEEWESPFYPGYHMSTLYRVLRFYLGREVDAPPLSLAAEMGLDGLARWIGPGGLAGHLVVVRDRHVLDPFQQLDPMPIHAYADVTGTRMQTLWR